MKTVYFATTNERKIQLARAVCTDTNIHILPVDLSIDEIQGEDPGVIVEAKARQAYKQLQKPIIVTDISWDIKALKGFPGAYMKSINHWFSPEDFLRLMSGIEDRTIVQHQHLAYIDDHTLKLFHSEINGKIINEVRGENPQSPSTTVTALDTDNGMTIAEVYNLETNKLKDRYRKRNDTWLKFVEWYNNY